MYYNKLEHNLTCTILVNTLQSEQYCTNKYYNAQYTISNSRRAFIQLKILNITLYNYTYKNRKK